jgi:hypothetical protein
MADLPEIPAGSLFIVVTDTATGHALGAVVPMRIVPQYLDCAEMRAKQYNLLLDISILGSPEDLETLRKIAEKHTPAPAVTAPGSLAFN